MAEKNEQLREIINDKRNINLILRQISEHYRYL
jgi:hypothetical protein